KRTMSLWTLRNAPPTIALVTQHSLPAASVSAAALSTTHSRFSAMCSAALALEAEFSRHSSAAVAHVRKTGAADQICATTWKSNWRRRLLARTSRLRSRNWTPAINARAAALNRARAGSVVPLAAAVARSLVRVDFFIFHRHVPAVMAPVRSSKNRARNAAATDAWKKRAELSCKFPLESEKAPGCVP